MSTRFKSRWALGAIAASVALPLLLASPPAAVLGDTSAVPASQAQPTPVSPQATPTSGQPTPVASPTATKRELKFFSVAPRFEQYYALVDGYRTMGNAISPLSNTGFPSQYFEKARLEDHTATEKNPVYMYQYGLLVDELTAVHALVPIGGDQSTVTYNEIAKLSDPGSRVAPPSGFSGGTATVSNGDVFVPFSADLSPTQGHVVPKYFWDYINKPDLFPGGWLHDVGLPITEAIPATVSKGVIVGTTVTRVTNRPIMVQAFQRTILTYDPANPEGYLVERANVGTDYWSVFPDRVPG